ncbi:MAG: hypothetical protein HYV15_08105 [Elusimicrobia bacterium]|nr:hypothetical protein [Elusimicrobiota bacterium]
MQGEAAQALAAPELVRDPRQGLSVGAKGKRLDGLAQALCQERAAMVEFEDGLGTLGPGLEPGPAGRDESGGEDD